MEGPITQGWTSFQNSSAILKEVQHYSSWYVAGCAALQMVQRCRRWASVPFAGRLVLQIFLKWDFFIFWESSFYSSFYLFWIKYLCFKKDIVIYKRPLPIVVFKISSFRIVTSLIFSFNHIHYCQNPYSATTQLNITFTKPPPLPTMHHKIDGSIILSWAICPNPLITDMILSKI